MAADKQRMRATVVVEYDIFMQYAKEGYGTEDPAKIAELDRDLMNGPGDYLVVTIEAAESTEVVKVEVVE